MKRHRPKIVGIYKIRNLVNGKCYVGSAVDMESRWGLHEWSLDDGTHCNTKLQRAWNKYGSASFVFEFIEECLRVETELAAREQFWMDRLDVVKNGYNIEPNARTPLGRKWRKASRIKSSVSAVRVAADPAERKRRSERATRQHREGTLGRSTWSSKSEKSFSKKIKQRNPDATAAGLIAHWKKPESREAQSIKLSAFASANPDEMSRRASSYWNSLTAEERKAHGKKTAASPGRSAAIGKTVAETWKDPAVRASRIAGLKAAALRRKLILSP